MKKILITTACVAALACLESTSALAMSAVLNGGYSGIDLTHGGPSLNDWNVSGAVAEPTGWQNISLEADGGFANISGFGNTVDDWNLGGSLFMSGSDHRIAATSGWDQAGSSHGSDHIYTYGAGGEFYPSNMFTIAAKVGGLSGSAPFTGWYVGGEGIAYVNPDIAISGTVDYAALASGYNETDLTIKGEWLIWEAVPVSISSGYTYSTPGGLSVNANTFFVALHLYGSDSGAATLTDRQRTGTLGWLGSTTPLGLNF